MGASTVGFNSGDDVEHPLAKKLLGGILFLAVILRLPNMFAPMFCDESCTTIANCLKFFSERTIIPEDVIYPTLYSYLSAIVLAVWNLLLLIFGPAQSFEGVGMLLFTGQAPLLPPLRLLTLAFDLGAITAAYLLGKELRNRRCGLLGALFVCLSMNHIAYARWALPDVPMAFFSTVALLFALKIAQEPKLRWYLLAGAFAGLAISTKYNAGTIVIAIAVAHFITKRSDERVWATRETAKISSSACICVSAFLFGSPVWLIKGAKVLNVFRETGQHVSGGHYFVPGGPSYVWVGGYLAGVETSIGILAVAGLLWAIYSLRNHAERPRKLEWIVAASVVANLAVVGAWQTQHVHYLLSSWPALMVLGAILVEDAASRFRRSDKSMMIAATCICVFPLFNAVIFGLGNMRTDNRVAAESWIQANIPAGTVVGVDWSFIPVLYDSKWMAEAEVNRREHLSREEYALWRRFADKTRAFHLVPIEYSDAWLESSGAEYVITSDRCYLRFQEGEIPPEGHPFREGNLARRRFYKGLFSEDVDSRYRVLKAFSDGSGPVVKILRKKP